MRKLVTAASTVLLLLGTLALEADADPEDRADQTHDGQPPTQPTFVGPEAVNVTRLAGVPKEGTTNSDLAFWKDLAIAANYGGFRIFDISLPQSPRLLSDFACYGPQNDVSVYQIQGRLYLWQSVDRALTSSTCSATPNPTPIVQDAGDANASRARYGFEGIRMFDITDPANPRFLTSIATACGSHTHTLVPDKDNQKLFLYVSSYPLGSGITPTVDRVAANERQCLLPHQKISVVEVPFSAPTNLSVREVALSADTTDAPGRGFKACHDIQAVLSDDLAIGACGGDVQVWDIADRGNPTTTDEARHTHFRNPQWDFMHNAMATYDGKVFAFVDETGGGGGAECDGSASDDGFMYLYPAVRPGDPPSSEVGRYMIPRAQGAQICVSHNGQIIPVTDGRYLASLAYYQGGTSIVDFTDPAAPREVGYIDTSNSDAWSSYWYNGYVFHNGGLHRRTATGATPCNDTDEVATNDCSNPGFEVYALTDVDGSRLRTRAWHHLNPQTQEGFQQTGR
jgi:hypothetical protein